MKYLERKLYEPLRLSPPLELLRLIPAVGSAGGRSGPAEVGGPARGGGRSVRTTSSAACAALPAAAFCGVGGGAASWVEEKTSRLWMLETLGICRSACRSEK